jgi:hypothetical protein
MIGEIYFSVSAKIKKKKEWSTASNATELKQEAVMGPFIGLII